MCVKSAKTNPTTTILIMRELEFGIKFSLNVDFVKGFLVVEFHTLICKYFEKYSGNFSGKLEFKTTENDKIIIKIVLRDLPSPPPHDIT